MSTTNGTRGDPPKVATRTDSAGKVESAASSSGWLLRWVVIEGNRIRVLVFKSTFNGLPFFGGLFAYAHATPGLLDRIGVDPPGWVVTASYVSCLAATWVIGVIVNELSSDKRPDKRVKITPRVARVLSSYTTLTGLFMAAKYPTMASLPYWPIIVMTLSTLLYEGLHLLFRKRDNGIPPTDGDHSADPDPLPVGPATVSSIIRPISRSVGCGNCSPLRHPDIAAQAA